MDLKEAIKRRRSIRRFNANQIKRSDIEEIISSATLAPSACNKEAWKFIVVDNARIKERIVDEGGPGFIKEAPSGILVLYDNRTDNIEYRDHIQSAAAAIQNMLLTATSLGIGSCWVCHLPHKSTLRRLLKIPKCFDPIAYVVLGYYDYELKPNAQVYPLDKVIAWNEFNFALPSYPIAGIVIKRIARYIYFSLPLFLKKALRPVAERFVKKFD